MQVADRTHISTTSHPSAPVRGDDAGQRPGDRWALAVGALIAFAVIREGFRWINQQPKIAAAKPVSTVEAVGPLFVLREGLRRLGAWVLRAPVRGT